jgi:pimeloyl-ACP methyl ester carboxylesterase
MLGSAMRLLERSRDGVLSADLIACNRYANGVDAAKAIRCPVLAIVATRDVMAPRRNAQPLLAALPQVTTIRLDDTGHALMAERPGEVLDALRPFA